MSPRSWPAAPREVVESPPTVIDDSGVDPLPTARLCRCGPSGWGCERHGTHPRRDVPHTTRGGVGLVGALRRTP